MSARGRDARHAHARHRPVRPALRRARPGAGRGARAPLRHGGRQRPPVLRAGVHRADAAAEPAAGRAARHPGHRGGGALPADRRGQRGRRRLLRPVRERRARLDGRDGRRVRQGPRRRRRDRARALHAAGGRDARAAAEPQPRPAQRGAAAPARRPPLLHGRLRVPRAARPGGAASGFASGGHPLPLLLRADGTVEAVGEPGTLLGVVPDPNFEDLSLSLGPATRIVFYTDGVIEGRGREPRARRGAARASWWRPAPAPEPTRSPRASRTRPWRPRAAARATTSRFSCSGWPLTGTPSGCKKVPETQMFMLRSRRLWVHQGKVGPRTSPGPVGNHTRIGRTRIASQIGTAARCMRRRHPAGAREPKHLQRRRRHQPAAAGRARGGRARPARAVASCAPTSTRR